MNATWTHVRAQLERLTRPFPHEAIALAEAHRDEIAPQLVAALEELAADPAAGVADSGYMLHLYAMHLLASWRDGRASRPLLTLGRMRDHEAVEDLFGDHLNESYGRCVASVSGGDVEPIMALCNDTQASVWARAAGLDALKACVAEGDADRDKVIAYLHELGEREANALRCAGSSNDAGFELLDAVVSLATDLGAVEMLPVIRGWFAEDLMDETFADLDFVEAQMALPVDACLRKILAENDGYVGDAVKEMSWWAAFGDTDDDDDDGYDGIDWEPAAVPYVREGPKIGRNDPCPCGSGKKYKKCHGAV